MRDSAAALQLGSEFDAFLFAPVERDETGVVLSVISALARLDIDPWREAAELTGMTRAAANQRLVSLIAALPASSTRPLPGTIANRLIELLPRRDASAVVTRAKLLGAAAPKAQDITRMLVINLLLVVGMLCAQWVFTSLGPPSDAEAVHAPTSSMTLPPTTPPGRGTQTIG